MQNIRYVVGDATNPPPGRVVVTHVCNDIGAWGRGFVMAISKRWGNIPKERYTSWRQSGTENGIVFGLGKVQFVDVGGGVTVANIIGQEGVKRNRGKPPVRYTAIREGLEAVAEFAVQEGASVHMPRIGCGLAGGNWNVVGHMVQASLADRGIATFVYDLSLAD